MWNHKDFFSFLISHSESKRTVSQSDTEIKKIMSFLKCCFEVGEAHDFLDTLFQKCTDPGCTYFFLICVNVLTAMFCRRSYLPSSYLPAYVLTMHIPE